MAERPLLRRLRQAGVAPEEGLDIGQRKPDWVRVPVRIGKGYRQLGSTVHDLGLVTVCEEAGCPNIYECWADGTATFMINGERCTRACGFCQVDTRHPLPLSPDEPERVAEAVERMRLGHAVITCVARDDLPDGGAGAMAQTIRAIRSRTPGTTVEVLISDCRGDAASLDTIFEARPDVLNHNIETVARLQRAVRPSAGYARSLAVLARAGQAGLVTKSGLMVGLGEREDEVVATMADLRGVGVSIVTIGQYLRPSRDHLPVSRYWAPEEFDRLREAGTALGVAPCGGVAAHPVELSRPRGGSRRPAPPGRSHRHGRGNASREPQPRAGLVARLAQRSAQYPLLRHRRDRLNSLGVCVLPGQETKQKSLAGHEQADHQSAATGRRPVDRTSRFRPEAGLVAVQCGEKCAHLGSRQQRPHREEPRHSPRPGVRRKRCRVRARAGWHGRRDQGQPDDERQPVTALPVDTNGVDLR